MTKNTVISKSTTRMIVAWVVIALLTISIMKASAIASSLDRTPVFRPIPALNWNSTF
ncbi:MAG: hypothetical protein U0694_07305 [Anaerolineae bacterium]